jgi:hypothetical protein
MVLDSGKVSHPSNLSCTLANHVFKVAELDTPQNLLADKGSIFYSLAAEAGLAGSVAPPSPS